MYYIGGNPRKSLSSGFLAHSGQQHDLRDALSFVDQASVPVWQGHRGALLFRGLADRSTWEGMYLHCTFGNGKRANVFQGGSKSIVEEAALVHA